MAVFAWVLEWKGDSFESAEKVFAGAPELEALFFLAAKKRITAVTTTISSKKNAMIISSFVPSPNLNAPFD
jgi:hypothetical protein